MDDTAGTKLDRFMYMLFSLDQLKYCYYRLLCSVKVLQIQKLHSLNFYNASMSTHYIFQYRYNFITVNQAVYKGHVSACVYNI